MSTKLKEKVFNKNIGIVLILLLIVAGGAFFCIQNPNFFTKNSVDVQSEKITALENKILKLEQMLEKYHSQIPVISKEDIVALNEKVDDLGKVNAEILNSKASIASQVGLIERMDGLEFKVNKLGQASSQSALILTAASLVKEAAAKGEPFVYEATVLEELSVGTPMAKSAEVISFYADKGFSSQELLINNFNEIYEETFSKKEATVQNKEDTTSNKAKDWIAKITNKLRELIVIKRLDDSAGQNEKDTIWKLVNEGDLQTASFKMEHDPKYQTESFEIWRQKVNAEKIFNKALGKIQALTLGFLKAERLKNNEM